jgi:hypothetical protein
VKQYVDDGLLRLNDKDAIRFVGFFMSNAKSSLLTASILAQVSDEEEFKITLNLGADLSPIIFVGNCLFILCYVLRGNWSFGKAGCQATGQIVHRVKADAFIFFFGLNEKLAKLFEQYEEA